MHVLKYTKWEDWSWHIPIVSSVFKLSPTIWKGVEVISDKFRVTLKGLPGFKVHIKHTHSFWFLLEWDQLVLLCVCVLFSNMYVSLYVCLTFINKRIIHFVSINASVHFYFAKEAIDCRNWWKSHLRVRFE